MLLIFSYNFLNCRFLLNDCVCSDTVKQMLLILRNIEMQPLAGDKAENCYKNQVQIIKTLKMYMLLARDMTDAVITVIKDINKNPKPLDLIILLLVYGTIRQKNAETLLKQNIRCGFYRISLLHMVYNNYKEVCIYFANIHMYDIALRFICIFSGCSRITIANIAISE